MMKSKMKTILKDHWDGFVKIYNKKIRPNVKVKVDPCKCPNCNTTIQFNDIVYSKYGSIREYLRKRIVEENEEKLEKVLELYAITKGIIYGRINSKTT